MLIPPSTNADYEGSTLSACFLVFLGVAWIVPGLIHSTLADGGAGVIAGIDMRFNPHLVVALFAWAGATQLAHGCMMVMIGLRWRTLVPLMLLISLVERSLLALSGWVRHVPPSGHHPPEHYGSLIAVPLIAVALWFSLRRR